MGKITQDKCIHGDSLFWVKCSITLNLSKIYSKFWVKLNLLWQRVKILLKELSKIDGYNYALFGVKFTLNFELSLIYSDNELKYYSRNWVK